MVLHTCSTKRKSRHLADFPHEVRDALDRSVLSSSRLRSHIVPLALAVVKSTANPSRSPNLVAHDANFDGLTIAAVSHAFNSFESMHNTMTSSSLRSSTFHSGLSDSSIFSNTSVLLDARLFMHCSYAQRKMFICSGAASAASPTTSSTLHVLWSGTSTSAYSCCSSAFAASSSTSSPCLFWPRLSATLTRFASRSSVSISLALEHPPLLRLTDAGFQPPDEQSQTLAQIVSGHRPLP